CSATATCNGSRPTASFAASVAAVAGAEATAAARAPSRAASSTASRSRAITASWTMPSTRSATSRSASADSTVACPRTRVIERASQLVDDRLDGGVEQTADRGGTATGGRPADHEHADERRGEQDERVLGRGLTALAAPLELGEPDLDQAT